MRLIIKKGGPGSGHWGHAGRPGKHGGSASRSVAMSIRTGKDAALRQAAAKLRSKKTATTAGFQPGKPGIQTWDPDAKDNDLANFIVNKSGTAPGPEAKAMQYWNPKNDPGAIDGTTRAEVKEQLVKDVHNKIPKEHRYDPDTNPDGITESDINNAVGTWAVSSNDNNRDALSMQQAVSEEFGVPLSQWQQSRINETHKPVNTHLGRDNEKIIARAIYNNTQEKLAAAGFKPDDEVQLFRGVNIIEEKSMPSGTKYLDNVKLPVGVANFQGNTIESWSSHAKVATEFTAVSSANVLSQSVPVKNIFSTCRTGFGCLAEGEFVVFNVPGTQVTVTEIGRK